MIRNLSAASILIISLILSACGGGGGGGTVVVEDPHDNFVPELRAFDIIDSYDVDTANPNHPPLALSPYLYDGLYEVFWNVNSLEDYRVTLRINDTKNIAGSLPIYTQTCGAGRQCDQAGGWVCEYTSDFYMSCEGSGREVDIYPLVNKMPQKVHLFIEVCDYNSNYCEYDYYPVTLE